MCPVCTIGIAAGVGLSRYFGFNDVISGLWIGAAVTAFSILTANWLVKKSKEKNYRLILLLSFIGWWVLTIMPLKWMGIISSETPKVFGINYIIFGSFLGIIISKLTIYLEKYLRKFKEGKALFPYQKVIVPITILLLFSFVLFLIFG